MFPPEISNLDEFFSEGNQFANRATLTLAPRCLFGSTAVIAVRADAGRYECTSPSAALAGAAMNVQLQSRAHLLAELELSGGAMPSGDNGVLLLTGAPHASESGAAVFKRPLARETEATDAAMVEPTTPLHDFEVTCQLRIASHGPHDGFSVSYAANLSHERGYGSGDGLRFALLPFEKRARAWLEGVLVADAPVVRFASTEHHWPFQLSVRRLLTPGGESSDTAELHVEYGSELILMAHLDRWRDLVQATWRVGVGAGTAHEAHYGDGSLSTHSVSDLALRMGAAYFRAEVPFGISYNGQDFYPLSPALAERSVASGFSIGATVGIADFIFGLPIAASILPRTGVPFSQIAVRGHLLPFQRGLDRSGGYRCRFQELVRAPYQADYWGSLFDPLGSSDAGWILRPSGAQASIDAEFSEDTDDEYLICDVPTLRHGRYAVELSLHDAQWGADDRHFIALEARAEPLHATPDEAPAQAAAQPLVGGVDLEKGIAYACRALPSYATADGTITSISPATYVSALRAIRCMLPQPASDVALPLELTVQVSLDGAQFNVGGAAFTYRAPPLISAFLPLGGPTRGATEVKVIGTHLGSNTTSPAECLFGATAVRAHLGTAAAGSSNTTAEEAALDGIAASRTQYGIPDDADGLRCVAPAASWAGLLFGPVDSRPALELTGVWIDSFGHEAEVCSRNGALAVSIPVAHAAAVAIWDEQRSGYVGLWQQWREHGAEARVFPYATGDENIDSQRYARGYFRWGMDHASAMNEVVEAEVAAAAAAAAAEVAAKAAESAVVAAVPGHIHEVTDLNASSSNVSVTSNDTDLGQMNQSANAAELASSAAEHARSLAIELERVLNLTVSPKTVIGAWASHGAGRYFGDEATLAAVPHGEWSATFKSALPQASTVCSWLEGTARADESSTGIRDPVHATSLADALAYKRLAHALYTRPPFVLLGAAQQHHGFLQHGLTRRRPAQIFELTAPILGAVGGVAWDPEPRLAAHPGCRHRLSLRVAVYAGDGDGGDGLTLALGSVTDVALLGEISDSDISLAARDALVLRMHRLSPASRGMELWHRGIRCWHTSTSIPTASWVQVHLVLIDASHVNLKVGNTTLLLRFALPAPVLDRRDPAWRFGIVASTRHFRDRHAVASVRGSCGDGQIAAVPFTISADGHHVAELPPSPTEGDASRVVPIHEHALQGPAMHHTFQYYAEPQLLTSEPALGHIEGGSLVRVRGVHLENGVAYRCGFGESMTLWTPATWQADVHALVCRSAAVPDARMAPLRVALNGQQLSEDNITYAYHAARISTIAPGSGPTFGGTTLQIRGQSLQVPTGMPQARCSFNGTLQTPASWSGGGDGPGMLRCATPELSGVDASTRVSFSISLNGQDLTQDSPPFTFFYIFFAGAASRDAAEEQLESTSAASPPPPPALAMDAPPFPPGGAAPPPDPFLTGDCPVDASGGLTVCFVDRRSGPVSGGSDLAIRVSDVPLESASTPKCKFGETVVDAVLQTTFKLTCTSPNATEAGPIDFQVSLNAQDYSTSGGQFCFINVTHGELEPTEGPNLGGTRLLTRAPGLVPHGCQPSAAAEPKQCKLYNPSTDTSVIVPASVSSSRGALMCYTPPMPASWTVGLLLEMSVSLNSRDFTRISEFKYEQVPELPTLHPGCGPIMGGTVLELHGNAMRDVPTLMCYFGARHASAKWVSDSLVSCLTPDLPSVTSAVAKTPDDATPVVASVFELINDISRAAFERSPIVDLLFDESVARDAALGIAGTGGPAAVSLGALTLSSGVTVGDDVAIISSASDQQPGNGLMRLTLPNANAPLRAFDMHVELLFASSGASGDGDLPRGGLMIEYGPDPDGEYGEAEPDQSMATGIAIALLASADDLLISAWQNASSRVAEQDSQASAALLGPPVDVWLGLHLAVFTQDDDRSSFLRISVADVQMAPPVELHDWEPQSGWSIRLRATGQAGVGVSIYRIQLFSGGMSTMSLVPMVVAVGPLFVSPTAAFAYFTPPVVLPGDVVPASGPTSGGTMVRIRVANYSLSIGSLASSVAELRCRFGTSDSLSNTVSAFDWHDENATRLGIECASPAVGAAGVVPLLISANAQQYTQVGDYNFYDAPAQMYATPRAGPIHGGAMLTFRGDNLRGGTAYTCRIGGAVVSATYHTGPERVQCYSPALAISGPSSSLLGIALNGQQHVALHPDNGTFFVYRPPGDFDAAPLTGPANGGTTVDIHIPGGGLPPAVDDAPLAYRCAFGHVERASSDHMITPNLAGVVVASYVSEEMLRCVSPSAEEAGAAEYLQLLGRDDRQAHFHVLGAALVYAEMATLTGGAGECGSLLVPPRRSSSGRARAEWFEHSMLVRARAIYPPHGEMAGERIASAGGFSWSYADLPPPDSVSKFSHSNRCLGVCLGLKAPHLPRH